MTRYYHDERRANEPGYLPTLVVEWVDSADEPGYYYHFAQPGCLPDSDSFGPFETKEEALEHARLDLEDLPSEEPYEDPVQADADVLRSAGWGTDEDYGYCGED